MKIKPKYTDLETTPLKFLKFIRITLWIGLFLTVAEIISQFTSGMDWYMLGINLVGGVLTLAAISGLNRMEWYGVKAYCGSFLLRMMDGLLAVGIYAYSGRIEESGSAVGSILGSGIGLLLVWIYFQKRRLLFTPIPEEYLPLIEKEQELVQEFTQEEKAEPVQTAEEEPVPSPSEPTEVPLTDNRSSAAEQSVKEDSLVSRFCWNCGAPLIRESKFCDLCGKEVCRPSASVQDCTVTQPKSEPMEKKTSSSAELEKSSHKSGKSWLGLVLVLLVVGVAVGVLLLSPPQLPAPMQAAENVLYLEVYDSADVCIGSGSGFLVENQTTLVTNYHVIENASYILVAAQDGELAAEVDTVLAYDVELDLAVLQCSQQVNAQPLRLGDSDLVKQGDKIYAVSYPLGIANTLTDGIVSSKYVDELNVELLQITAPISEGSSGGALLNENGQVVGVVCGSYTDGQNMNVAISVNQLFPLLEKVEETPLMNLFGAEMGESPPIAETEGTENEKERIPEEASPQEPEEPSIQPEERPKQSVTPEITVEEEEEEVPVGEVVQPVVQPDSISLSETTFFLKEGESKTLTVQIEPAGADGKITWTSSMPETVEVRDGVVTVLNTDNAGAIITAATENGLSAECEVLAMSRAKVSQKFDHGYAYVRFPQVLSIENVSAEGQEIGLWWESSSFDDGVTDTYMYVYQTPSIQVAKNIVIRYINLLGLENGWWLSGWSDEHCMYTMCDPDQRYEVHVRAEDTDYAHMVSVWVTQLNQYE